MTGRAETRVRRILVRIKVCMTPAKIRRVLEQVTEEILDRMRHEGFHTEPGAAVRFDPIVWDINNGFCEKWAFLAADRIAEAFPAWIGDVHCVLVYKGRYYDADCLDGVDDVEDLPMFADPLGERPES